MLKKRTAIFFLLLANIILLAHAAVPHHHHNSQVCIPVAQTQTCRHEHKNCATEHRHEHEGNKNTECCALKNIVVIPSNTLRHEYQCFDSAGNHSGFDYFQAIIFTNGTEKVVKRYFTTIHPPLISACFTHYACTCLGMRAPPVS